METPEAEIPARVATSVPARTDRDGRREGSDPDASNYQLPMQPVIANIRSKGQGGVATMTGVFCGQCGKRLSAGDRFCDGCGELLGPRLETVPNNTRDTSVPSAGESSPEPGVHQRSTVERPLTSGTAQLDYLDGLSRPHPPARSKAWVYYLVLAILSLIATFTSGGVAILGALLFGAYSAYLYRGGRVVVWFW